MPSRESELYKDKVEVSLDGRQIFYLFFGGAVIVGIVFVLGVLVGRRVEARGHVDHARTTAAADPLAALDRLEGSGGMAFRGEEATAPVEKKIDQLVADKKKGEPAAKSDKKDEAKPEKKDDAKVETKDDAKADKKDEAKAEPKKDEAKKDEAKKDEAKKDDKVAAKDDKVAAKDDKVAAKDDKVAAKSADKPADKPIEKPSEKSEDKPATKEEKTRYTLQLSSFQDKAEAEAYLAKMKEQGFQAQITQADVEGKGTFYRVRMGSYRSLDAATNAKSEFEKASSKSASIMKL